MAEGNSPKGSAGVLAKKVQKQLSRGKEKVLQRLGKTVESRDEIFDNWLHKFNDQQTDGNRIHKDLKVYLTAVRDMREASRRLSQSLFDAYESDWVGEEDLGAIVEGEDLLWNDYEVKLSDQAVHTMESYMAQFPDVRDKISKRGRKLVDYDCSRHHLESLQTAKKRDDVKLAKAEEELNAAKHVYEAINAELKEDLPAFYDSRIGCYVSVFSAISCLQDVFHKEMSTLSRDLQSVMKDLQAQHPDKVFAVKGLQRHGSMKRRSLMSPKWKSSFSDFHLSYSPKLSAQRFSFRSPDKPRYGGNLSRQSSTTAVSARSPPLERPSTEFREEESTAEEETESLRSDTHNSPAEARLESDMPNLTTEDTTKELKSEEDQNGGEEEKHVKDAETQPNPVSHSHPDDGEHGRKSALSESSSELDNSSDSESLELQLSAVGNSTLHVEETQEHQPNESLQPNGLDHCQDPDLKGVSKKDVPLGNQPSQDSKSTVV